MKPRPKKEAIFDEPGIREASLLRIFGGEGENYTPLGQFDPGPWRPRERAVNMLQGRSVRGIREHERLHAKVLTEERRSAMEVVCAARVMAARERR